MATNEVREGFFMIMIARQSQKVADNRKRLHTVVSTFIEELFADLRLSAIVCDHLKTRRHCRKNVWRKAVRPKKKKRKQVIWRKRKNDSFLPFVIFVITSYLGHNKNIMQRSCNHGYRKENRLLLFPAITESKENLRKLTFVGKMAAAGYVTQGCFVSNLMILWRDNLTKRCFIKHRLLCNRS